MLPNETNLAMACDTLRHAPLYSFSIAFHFQVKPSGISPSSSKPDGSTRSMKSAIGLVQ